MLNSCAYLNPWQYVFFTSSFEHQKPTLQNGKENIYNFILKNCVYLNPWQYVFFTHLQPSDSCPYSSVLGQPPKYCRNTLPIFVQMISCLGRTSPPPSTGIRTPKL